LWQIFGLERDGNRFKWVTSSQPASGGTPGETVQAALDEIGVNAANPLFPNNVQRNLGAVVMSLGAGASNLSDLKCGAGDGQASVDLLRRRGIAVVVALQNEDIPSDTESWPACLRDVVLVAGESANSSTGARQAGVGGNRGIDFFAKDTTNDNQIGNSFAAPRVASAYAKLHELFPRSSVGQKTEALNGASTLTDTYRTRLVNGQFRTYTARKLRRSHMAAAISNLTLLQPPPQDDATTDLNIVDNDQYGPFFDDSDAQPYSLVLDFNSLPQTTRLAGLQGQTVLRAGTSVLSSRRDIEFKFTTVFRGGNLNTNTFRLMLNGRRLQFTPGSFGDSTPRQRTIIINRNLLNEGANQLSLVPSSNAEWGLTDISVRFLPSVPLTVGETNTTRFGYEENPSRFTGLRANFEISGSANSDFILSATGYDIDRIDETAVFVNGNFIGNLNVGPSSAFSTPNRFTLGSEILRTGTNFIEFVQREPQDGVWEGFEDEKWAITNLNVSAAVGGDATIVPVILLLLNDDTPPP